MSLGLNPRQNLGFDKFGVTARHRVVLQPSFASLCILSAIGDGDANHHRDAMLRNQRVQGCEEHPVWAIRAYNERRRSAWPVTRRDVDGDLARPRRRTTVRHDHLCSVLGIGPARNVGNAGDARINLAFSRSHREDHNAAVTEVRDRAFGIWLRCKGRELGRRRMGGTQDEVAIRSRRRKISIRKLHSLHKARAVGVARGRHGTLCLRGMQ